MGPRVGIVHTFIRVYRMLNPLIAQLITRNNMIHNLKIINEILNIEKYIKQLQNIRKAFSRNIIYNFVN